MKWEILVGVLAYELIVIVGLGLYFSAREKHASEGGFLLSNRDLPYYVVAVTLALTVLGTPHIFGVFEMTWFIGASSIWFGLAHAVLLVVTCTSTALWARRLQVTSMPEMLALIFGETPRLMVGCVMSGLIWGILTLESQGVGIVFATVTGVTIQQGAILGGILGILYVVLAGMKEIGWVNLINCAVMYVGLVIAMIYLTLGLPAGGWEAVSDFYVRQDQAHMLSLFGTPEVLWTFALSIVLSTTFCQSVSQQLIQPAMAAKSEEAIRKSLWIAVPLNGVFCVFIACIGLAAKADPAFNGLGPKLAAPTMLLTMLPGWLVAWLMASLLAAVLSSFAMAVMAPATIFTIDVYKNFFNPAAGEADERRVTRIMILVLGVAAFLVAAYLPPIVQAMNWLFAWMTPVFWLIIIGLFWKRSSTAAVWTLAVSWILNGLWSFSSLPALIGLDGTPNVYATLVSGLVLGIGLTAVCDGLPGLFRSVAAAPRPEPA
ncbi:sodium:solute symporter family protein [Rhodoplanes azumiensis]|uniref:Sodium:solute symporter n=1 Tax=Rhodoplanes azumiensis TaxID=1897628 RepID=A0ABW5ANB5_9BRAD